MAWLNPPWRELARWAGRPRLRAPRRTVRLTLLARMQGLDEARVELLRELAANGAKLDAVVQQPGWSVVLEIKDELQAIATEQGRGPSSTDAQRRDAAQAYWAIEGLFGTIYRTIANGQKAGQTLSVAVKG